MKEAYLFFAVVVAGSAAPTAEKPGGIVLLLALAAILLLGGLVVLWFKPKARPAKNEIKRLKSTIYDYEKQIGRRNLSRW